MTPFQSYPDKRLLFALGCGLVTFAFAPILARFGGEFDPVAITSVRTVSAAVILAPFWYFYRDKYAESTYSLIDNVYAALAGVFLGLHFILWIASLAYTSVASASVLVTVHPVILILLEALFFKRAFSQRVWIGVFIAFSGSVLLGISDNTADAVHPNPLLGNIMALSAAFLFAGYFLISRRLRQKSDWLNYIFRVYGFTAMVCLIISLFLSVSFEADARFWIIGLALATGPQLIGHGAMNYAVRSIPPTFLSTLILSEPIGASLLALLIFAEVPPALSLLALVVIMAGVVITWKR